VTRLAGKEVDELLEAWPGRRVVEVAQQSPPCLMTSTEISTAGTPVTVSDGSFRALSRSAKDFDQSNPSVDQPDTEREECRRREPVKPSARECGTRQPSHEEPRDCEPAQNHH
jgi:hypothetical protein